MKKFYQEGATTILIGVLVLVIAFFIRLYNLTILPVFADEAIYIRWSQVMAKEATLRFLPLSDGKQPLFMWILMFWVNRFSDPLFIGRLLSVLCGIGTILGIFALTIVLFKSKKSALVSSLAWAVSPFSVFFERMALVDSMLCMFTVWTLFFGIITAKTRRLDLAMLTGFALGFAALTKSPAIFSAALLPSVWILGDFSKKRKIIINFLNSLFLLFVSYFIAFVMYNIQRLGPNFYLLTARTKDYIFPLSHLWENPKDPFIFYFHRALQWIWIMGPSFLYLLVIMNLLVKPKKYIREKLLLALWFIFPIIVEAMFAKTFTARYILFTLPSLFVLSGISLSYKNKKVLHFFAFLFVIFAAQAVIYDKQLLTDPEKADLPRSERSGYLEEWTAGTGIREVSSIIKNEHIKNPDKKIVVGTEGYFGTLPEGLQMYLEGVPNIIIVGVGLNIGDIPESLKESKKAGNKTFLVANSSRMNMEKTFEDRGLKIVASYQKAERPQDVKEYVLHGPRDTFYLFEVEKIYERN